MSERPGGSLPEYALYQVKVGEEHQELEFADPAGRWFNFTNVETLAHLRNDEGGRDTYVKLADETLVSVTVWKS